MDDDGESVLLGLGTLPTGVTEGSPDESVVSIVDDDDPAVSVSFASGSYSAAEGGSVEVKVRLSVDPERTVVVPLTARPTRGARRARGIIRVCRRAVSFGAGETSKSFTFTAASDSVDDDGESVKLGFGTLPTGVSLGSPDESVVSIVDDDDPAVSVSFGAAGYSAAEGGTVEVTVSLSVDPERTVVVPLTTTDQGGASSPGDYSGVPASVSFGAGETSKSFTFTAAADDVDDDGESVLLGLGTLPTGVTEGSPDESVVSIVDDDDPAVSVSFASGSYSAAEGGSVEVTVGLSVDPERTVVVPLTARRTRGVRRARWIIRVCPRRVSFGAGETSKSFTFTAASDSVDDDGESVLVGFGTLPAGVSFGHP